MICFAFHNPEDLRNLVDTKNFEIISVKYDEELPKIERAFETRSFFERVLFIRGADRLFSYYQQDHLNKFRIILFDNPQRFFVHKIVFADATPKSNGVWNFRDIPNAVLNDWLLRMRPGLVSESFAMPWSYDNPTQ